MKNLPKDIFRATFNNRNSNSNNSNICFPFCTLNGPKDKIRFKFLTTTIENHIYTHCANGQPEQEEEECNCKTKHDSKLCAFACVHVYVDVNILSLLNELNLNSKRSTSLLLTTFDD